MAGTIAVDVGGTFTDVTFADAGTGESWVAKTPSTPSDLADGFITESAIYQSAGRPTELAVGLGGQK